MAHYLADRNIAIEKIHHVPTFARDFGDREHEMSTEPYVLYFGRIVPEKGVETLLQAFNKIEKPSFWLKLMGNCSEQYHKQLLAMLDESHRIRVEIRNPEQGDALIDTIRHALFIVHPALWLENMPNTDLESMAAGKAIVASALGSMPELVKDGVNGRLFSPGNPTELAQMLVSLVDAPDKIREMGAFSRVLYERTYTEDAHMKILLQIFEAIVRNGQNGGLLRGRTLS
jgi:glycosyltransferase involved in cell wall biosynthesis